MTTVTNDAMPQVNYLAINGKYLTPNLDIIASASAITGVLTSSTATDWKISPNAKELSVNLTVQSVGGISPTLEIFFDVLDPIESANSYVVQGQNLPMARISLNESTPINSPSTIRFAISRDGNVVVWINGTPSDVGILPVPFKWQLEFVMSGTTPSFGVIGTFEARD